MHDANGTVLVVGDKVMIPAVIREVYSETGYCNATVVTTLVRRPDGHNEVITLNTGVVVKVSGKDNPIGL